MNPDEQNRVVSQVIATLGNRNAVLDKRLANLEGSEYSLLNFYGSMYQFNLGTVIAVASASTYYTVTGMVTGLVKGFTFGASQLTCTKAGVYLVNYQISFSGMVSNITKAAILKGGVAQQSTVSRVLAGTAGDYQQLSGSGIISLVVGDVITLAISNDTDVDDPTIDYASVTLNRVGD